MTTDSSATPTVPGAASALALWHDISHLLGQLGIASIRALLVNLGSLEFETAWTINETGEIRSDHPEWPADTQFPGMVTTISRIALAPAEEMLAQRRSLHDWVFAWRIDDSHVVVAETHFRGARDDISDSDKTMLRLLCDSSLRVKQATVRAPVATPDASATPDTQVGLETAAVFHTEVDLASSAASAMMPSVRSSIAAANIPAHGTNGPFTAGKWRPSPPTPARKTIAIPVGHGANMRPAKSKVNAPAAGAVAAPATASAAEAVAAASKPKIASPAPAVVAVDSQQSPGQPAADWSPSHGERREFPRVEADGLDWPALPKRAAKKLSLVSTLGLALAIVGTLLALWVAIFAVPDAVKSHRTDAQRQRAMADQTMVRDLSAALATGDYGDVQAALSSFESLGYFESALVSNARKRIVAQSGAPSGVRIGDELPAEFKLAGRTVELVFGSEPMGLLLLLREPEIAGEVGGLEAIQIAAIIVCGASLAVALLIALRLYRGAIARLLLRGR